MSAEFFTGCERLLSATANGVYQGMLVAAIAGLALRLFPRTNAATRHAIWFGVLLFVTALIPAHLLLSLLSRPKLPAATIQSASSTADSSVTDSYIPGPQPGQSDAGSFDGTPNFPGAGSQDEWASREIDSTSRHEARAAEKAWSRFVPSMLKPLSGNFETAISLPHSICLCLVSAWVLLATVRGGLIFGRIGEVRRVKTTSSVPSHGLQTLFNKLREALAARRNVQLRISSMHRTTVVLGFVHPVVLLPAEMDKGANEGELEHVLRHELAHVIRRDDWGNLAQQIIQAALFFHPGVWWISRKLSLEREIACDDYVLEGSGGPRAYALTLANVASRMNHCRLMLAPGVSNNNSQLQQRITMILNTHRDRSPRLARSRLGFFTATTAMLAVLAINAGPRLVLAQPPAAGPVASEPEIIASAPTAETPATLPPDVSGPESGPKFKPGPSDGDSAPLISAPESAPPAPEAPVPAQPPVARFPRVAPLIAFSPEPPEAPGLPESGVGPQPRPMKRRMSIEERLDRIERILDDLEARGQLKGRHRGGDGFSANVDLYRPDMPGGMTADFDAASKNFAAEAQRAAEGAERAAEAGQRAAEKATRDLAKLKDKDFEVLQENLRDMKSQGPVRELQALRDAREALGKEVEKLTKQIKRLEQEENRLKMPGRSDRSDDRQKDEPGRAP